MTACVSLNELGTVKGKRTGLTIFSRSYVYLNRLKRNISYINTNNRCWNINQNIIMLIQIQPNNDKTMIYT